MALATYTDLLASVATWINRSDLTAVIPDFVALAESRLSRDLRLRKQVSATTLSTVANTRGVTLPTDFLELENISISSTTPQAAMSVVTPEILDRKYPDTYSVGQPIVYALLGDQILFGPTPDGVYTIAIDYYARFTALSTTPTNWLLTNHPGLYLFPTLAEAHLYMMDQAQASIWEQRYQAAVDSLQSTDDESLRSGSAMRVRVL